MNHDPLVLDYSTPDSNDYTPPASIIGDVITHTKHSKQYVIIGVCWLGATDEWGFVARATDAWGVDIVRPLSHLYSIRSNGQRRYEEWQDYVAFSR